MVDLAFTDVRAAALYDIVNPWGPSYRYYLDRVMAAGSALDIGCGTGRVLRCARAAGHRGDLVGVDPADGMLAEAVRAGPCVEWVHGDVRSLALGRKFALVTMTGHAFQLLLDDDDVLAALRVMRDHVAKGGRVVFETRNPHARAWTGWTPEQSRRIVRERAGGDVEVFHTLRGESPPDLVHFTTTFRFLDDGQELESGSTLRFVRPDRLRDLVRWAGLVLEDTHGDWDGSVAGPNTPEFIVIARPA
ncbi:class I SAM-dependent methyltransferase [Streptomyces sp. NPDC005811]|uniref:class I SAM-dependent methyltransferase n=1 Tax=Streptomyces sp. NPDC005811 TaxID=3154565 RepID=UPI00340C3EA5